MVFAYVTVFPVTDPRMSLVDWQIIFEIAFKVLVDFIMIYFCVSVVELAQVACMAVCPSKKDLSFFAGMTGPPAGYSELMSRCHYSSRKVFDSLFFFICWKSFSRLKAKIRNEEPKFVGLFYMEFVL